MTDTKADVVTPSEWEDWLHNAFADGPEKFLEAAKSGEFKKKLDGYTSAYRDEVNATMKDLKAQLTEQTAASVLEMFKKNGVETDGRVDLRSTASKAVTAGTAYDENAIGVKAEGIWTSQAQMVQDILASKPNADQRGRLDKYEEFKNAYSGNVPSTGGFLIPEEWRSDILTRALEGEIVQPQAQVVPMPSGKMRWPINDMTTEVGSVYGGIQMIWLDEGQTFVETEAVFAALALEVHKLGGLASVPNELIRHISTLEAWLRQNLPNAIRFVKDTAFMKGNGVGKPLGGLHANNPALISVGAEVGQPSATITWYNVLSMYSRLLPESIGSAEWDITPDALPQIFSMALPVGAGGSAVMLTDGTQRPTMSILGTPIRWTRRAPSALGGQGDISLVDWSQYVVGTTTNIQLDTSEHSSFRSDKTDLRILLEVDGQPGQLSALTPENGGPTLSSFVQLAARP